MKIEQYIEVYEAPRVEIIEVAVEKGYANSLDISEDEADDYWGVG